MIQIVYCKSLLLRPDTALFQGQERLLPLLVVLNEWIVLQRIVNPLYIHFCHLVRRQLVIGNIIGSNAQEMGLGHAERLVDMRRIARTDL